MKHRCSPKCFYFPNETYGGDYDISPDGVKYRHRKHHCKYDGELIKSWLQCSYYCPLYKSRAKVILFLGKSASGKDTAINYLKTIASDKLDTIVSCTTRPIRDREKDGVDYYFISDSDFMQGVKNNEFADTRKYNTKLQGKSAVWRYGIKKSEITSSNKVKLCAVDVEGYDNLSEHFERDEMLVIYLDTSQSLRRKRAQLRGSFDETEWARRVKDDENKFSFSKMKNISDYIITNNGNLKDFQKELKKCLENEGII